MLRESFVSKPVPAGDESPIQSHRGLIATGAGLALSSPTAILWFAAIGGAVISTFGQDPTVLWKFTAGFAAGGLLWAAFFAWLTAALGCLLKERIAQVLSMISALVFVDGYRRLL